MANAIQTTGIFKQNLIHLVDKTCLPVYDLLDRLKDSITKKKFSLDSEGENVVRDIMSRYDVTRVNTFLNLNKLKTELKLLIKTLTPRIIWAPETLHDSLFGLYFGNSPWSLTLVSEDWENQTMLIQNEIMRAYDKGEIRRIQDEAIVGDPVLFLKYGKLKRGILTNNFDESLLITNIDNGHQSFCEEDEIFYPTITSQSHPAQALNCCIVSPEEFDESVWCAELNDILNSVLVESKLRITSWSKNSSVPPKFTVRLTGINHLNEEVDLTKWLEEDILKPWILEGIPSKISPKKFFCKIFQDPFKKKNRSLQMAPTELEPTTLQPSLNTNLTNILSMKRMSCFPPKTSVNRELTLEEAQKKMYCYSYQVHNYCTEKNCVRIHKKLNIVYGTTVTLLKVMDNINYPGFVRRYHCLASEPKMGQIVLAYCEANTTYYRGRVTGYNGQSFQVFLVDYGRTENIRFENLKRIEEQFLHYPFQAMKMNLGGITSKDPDKTSRYLNSIVGNTFKADVIDRDDVHEILSLKLYLCNFKTTLNVLLVEEELCEVLK